jgi:hypothetical protein
MYRQNHGNYSPEGAASTGDYLLQQQQEPISVQPVRPAQPQAPPSHYPPHQQASQPSSQAQGGFNGGLNQFFDPNQMTAQLGVQLSSRAFESGQQYVQENVRYIYACMQDDELIRL